MKLQEIYRNANQILMKSKKILMKLVLSHRPPPSPDIPRPSLWSGVVLHGCSNLQRKSIDLIRKSIHFIKHQQVLKENRYFSKENQ